jgi:hypothetical protein
VPLIRDAVHDIPPALENQVVRKLKCWISAMKLIKMHPSRVRCRLSGPPDQKFMTDTRQPTLDDFSGLQTSMPMSDRGQHPWTGRRLAVEFLEQPHMELVMKLGAWW